MIDRFSRWPEATPIKDTTADAVVTAFYNTWVSRFGAPITITSDRGSQFESAIFKAFTSLLGCDKMRTTAYHPSSNGIIERWHRSLKTVIMCHGTTDWTEVLPTTLLGVRTSIKEDIKAMAAEMLYGTSLRLPGEYFINEDMPAEPDIFIQKLREHMRRIRSMPTAHHCKRATFTHKDLYSCSHVFIRVDSTRKPLQPPYDGPYEVLAHIRLCLQDKHQWRSHNSFDRTVETSVHRTTGKQRDRTGHTPHQQLHK